MLSGPDGNHLRRHSDRRVLMHLMVQGAFWPDLKNGPSRAQEICLNAPYGARRFLTRAVWSRTVECAVAP